MFTRSWYSWTKRDRHRKGAKQRLMLSRTLNSYHKHTYLLKGEPYQYPRQSHLHSPLSFKVFLNKDVQDTPGKTAQVAYADENSHSTIARMVCCIQEVLVANNAAKNTLIVACEINHALKEMSLPKYMDMILLSHILTEGYTRYFVGDGDSRLKGKPPPNISFLQRWRTSTVAVMNSSGIESAF